MPSSSVIEQDEASTSGTSSGHYIEHIVTRLDTLAGVAIKYGVEVADIKRLNGLSTDLQMFALKTLRIPTPGRHPPGSRSESVPSTSHLHSHGEGGFANSKAMEKIQETPTMALLRDYYGLPSDDGIEMATISLDNAATPPAPRSNPAHSRRHSTGDYRMYGYNITPGKTTSESSLLMKPSKDKAELPLSSKEKRPIRRRTRDDSMDATILPRREGPPRKVDEGPSGGIKSLGAALLGKKEAVEGLLSKVLQPIQTPESGGRPLSERVPSAGSFFEGITSVYRNAKAALD
jgi:LysM repeat protein